MRLRTFREPVFLTIKIEKSVKEKLERIALRQKRTLSFIVREALEAYLENEGETH